MDFGFGPVASALGGLPVWLKYIFVVWVAIGCVVLVLTLWHVLVKDHESLGTGSSNRLQSAASDAYSSHHEAALAQAYGLDCSRYVASADPNTYTFNRRLCEALAELRANMISFATTRKSLISDNREWVQLKFNLDQTYAYLEHDFTNTLYGVKKEKLFELIEDFTTTATEMRHISSVQLYEKWSNDSVMTLDDMFLLFGFLEWCISNDATEKAKPSELYRLGPFFDAAFNDAESEYLNFRYVTDYTSSGEGYTDLISMFD